jgi:hypothetical protein
MVCTVIKKSLLKYFVLIEEFGDFVFWRKKRDHVWNKKFFLLHFLSEKEENPLEDNNNIWLRDMRWWKKSNCDWEMAEIEVMTL